MSDGTAPLHDTWAARDLPLLRLVAERVEATGAPVRTRRIADQLGLDRRAAGAAARALESGGYFTEVGGNDGGECFDVLGVTGRARRAVGLWPSPEVGYERLLTQLDELIAASTPRERTRLQHVRDALVASGGQVGVVLAGAVLGSAVGA